MEGRDGVFVMAATSRPDLVDVALLRPGRVDKSVYCGFPDLQERISLIRIYLKRYNFKTERLEGEDKFIEEIAK